MHTKAQHMCRGHEEKKMETVMLTELLRPYSSALCGSSSRHIFRRKQPFLLGPKTQIDQWLRRAGGGRRGHCKGTGALAWGNGHILCPHCISLSYFLFSSPPSAQVEGFIPWLGIGGRGGWREDGEKGGCLLTSSFRFFFCLCLDNAF